MGYEIGLLQKLGGDDTHYQFLARIKALAEANGWTTLRYDTVSVDRELILTSAGLSGTEEIYVGFKTYQNVSSDYYNFVAATFIGYISANSFYTQPGIKYSGVPGHNNAIEYFMNINPQRIVAMLKVGTPVYEHFYVGKFFPYARPSEWPSPLICAGMLLNAPATRFDNTAYVFPYHGYGVNAAVQMYIRDLLGNWVKTWNYPFSNRRSESNALAGPSICMVPCGEYYQLEPIILCDNTLINTSPSNVWGELDGVFFCSGFNNTVENVVQEGGSSYIDQTGMTVLQAVQAILAVGGRAFVMAQNVYRTKWRDYVAIEMN